MPSQSTAPGPDSPRVPSPQVLAGHVVCPQAAHEDLKDLVRSWLEFKAHWPEQLPVWLAALTADDQRRLGRFIATRQPWPGTTLLWWNCECNSTLAVCGTCNGEGMVGSGSGASEQPCDCTYSEAA